MSQHSLTTILNGLLAGNCVAKLAIVG